MGKQINYLGHFCEGEEVWKPVCSECKQHEDKTEELINKIKRLKRLNELLLLACDSKNKEIEYLKDKFFCFMCGKEGKYQSGGIGKVLFSWCSQSCENKANKPFKRKEKPDLELIEKREKELKKHKNKLNKLRTKRVLKR